MSLTLITEPTPTSPPSSAADWGYMATKVTALVQAYTGRALYDGSTIKAGTIIAVGASMYKATVDEAISGTVSDFVKITPSGASATASFSASLSGVSWSSAYGQYLDGSGNLYLFDEAKAVVDGYVSTPKTELGKIAHIYGSLRINGALSGVSSLTMNGAITGATNILKYSTPHVVISSGSVDLILPAMDVKSQRYFSLDHKGLSGYSKIYTPLVGTFDVMIITHPVLYASIPSSTQIFSGGPNLFCMGIITRTS